MDRRIKKFSLFLIILISFSIAAFSAYLHYDHLAGNDFLPTRLRFENPDPEGLAVDYHYKTRIFGIGLFSIAIPLQINHFKQLPAISSQPSPLDKRMVILRC